jgi:hypothetical protein
MIEEKRGETAWNIIAEQTKFVSELIQRGISEYLRGDVGEWFNILTAIREVINYDLKSNEKKQLNSIETKAWALQKYWRGYQKKMKFGHDADNNLKENKKIFVAYVRLYSRKLMSILKILGYFPKKEDRSKLSF